MPLNEKLTNLGANTQIDALSALIDGGFMDIYDGIQPSDADTPIGSQVLLASLGLSNPAFVPGVGGVALANAITPDASADATGTATWYRIYRSDHITPVMDGSVGTVDANLILTSVSVQAGASVSVESWSLTARKTG